MKPPIRRPRLLQRLRTMYELDRAGDKSAVDAAFLALPDECRAVLCLVMFYGRCKPRMRPCKACEGTGCTEHGFRDCLTCGGEGRVWAYIRGPVAAGLTHEEVAAVTGLEVV